MHAQDAPSPSALDRRARGRADGDRPRPGLAPFFWLVREIIAQNRRWFLCVPVFIAFGVLIYFAQSRPAPNWTLWVALMLVAGTVLFAARPALAGTVRRIGLLILALIALGYAAAGFRVESMGTVMLQRAGSFGFTALVEEAQPLARGQRLVLSHLVFEGKAPDPVPLRVRVTARGQESPFLVGDRIRLRARLSPPSPPTHPGGFDFARHAWFGGLGALGYSYGAPDLVERSAEAAAGTSRIEALRSTIATRVMARLPGDEGAVAAALLTGLRGGIDDAIWQAMQRSGLAHLLAISGLHMTLVAGLLFGLARLVFGLVPALTLRLPAKKPAALAAIAGAAFYLAISGASVPSQRAFLMVTIGFLAIMIDRNPISMRLLAWAAILVLLVRPETLSGPSFQLSFAAVTALIAWYEARRTRFARAAEAGPLGKGALYFKGVLETTVIASLATAPFTAFHFQNVATYGVIANLVAVPATSFVVMPAGILALMLMPLGIEGLALDLMGAGVGVVLKTAMIASSLPGASLDLVASRPAALFMLALGGVWLAIWQGRLRLLGIAPIALALILGLTTRPPDLLVNRSLDMALVRGGDAPVRLQVWKRDGWVIDGWLRSIGRPQPLDWPEPLAGPQADLACDHAGCVMTRAGWTVALSRSPASLADDCRLADLVIARYSGDRCESGDARLISSRNLRRSGGLALRIDEQGIAVRTVHEDRGAWPWVLERHRARADDADG